MARKSQRDENNYFRITFEDGSRVVWGWRPHVLRGDHMARFFAEEKEEAEAKASVNTTVFVMVTEPLFGLKMLIAVR